MLGKERMRSLGVLGVLATLGAALAFATQCTYAGAGWVATLTHDTPDARIAAYVAALARGSEEDALALWPGPAAAGSVNARPLEPSAPVPGGVRDAERARQATAESSAARRSQITHELAASGVHDEAWVRDRQWWTLC